MIERKQYPPSRYVFYPLYQLLRRRARLPGPVSLYLVYSASAVLHIAAALMTGMFPLAAIFAVVFLGGGAASAVAFSRRLALRKSSRQKGR